MTNQTTSPAHLLQALETLGRPRLLVLGDIILDQYTWGDAERVSQEAPVVVLRVDRREARLGGAASVCALAAGLQADVSCVGVIGDDESGATARRLLNEAGISQRLVFADPTRPTTSKERFIGRAASRHPNQMLRVDYESRARLTPELEQRIIDGICGSITDYDVLLISDYDKGVCTPRVLREVLRLAREAGVPTLVDPARTPDYQQYRQATVLKPNRLETETATGMTIRSHADALAAGQRLCETLRLELAIITLDRDGMALVRRDGTGQVFPTQARAVYDITGAGDMVLAMLGIALGCDTAPALAVQLSNVAAGLEVERTGVSIVTREEIRHQLLADHRPGTQKLVGLEDAAAFSAAHRARGERVVLTNGCFDLLHVGHVSYLAEAASLGDILIVAINSDASVRRLKGPQRPVINQTDRAAMLAALSCVHYVLVFDEETPHRVLEAVRPDVLVKGGTYAADEVVGREIVEAYGGRVCVTGVIPGVSTTNIVNLLVSRRSQEAA